MTYYLGIDPGVSGAIAILNPEGKLAAVEDLPVIVAKAGKKTRRRLDARTLGYRILELVDGEVLNCQVMLEDVHSMPRDGKAAAFTFGRSFGIIEGVVAALGLPYRFVTPQKWKPAMTIPKDKEAARLAVIQRYPDAAPFLKRKKDNNRAEAIALADYCRRLDTQQEMT